MTEQCLVGGAFNTVQNDRVAGLEVRVGDVKPGDQARLSTQVGAPVVRLASIEPCANGIKVIDIDDGARSSFGFRQETIVLRIQSASLPEEAA
jgi:hypothetical protein